MVYFILFILLFHRAFRDLSFRQVAQDDGLVELRQKLPENKRYGHL
jgi:hypothetical protein